jgi:hypothetical protein
VALKAVHAGPRYRGTFVVDGEVTAAQFERIYDEVVGEAHDEHRSRRSLLTRLDVGELARGHEVHGEHQVLVGRKQEVLAATHGARE